VKGGTTTLSATTPTATAKTKNGAYAQATTRATGSGGAGTSTSSTTGTGKAPNPNINSLKAVASTPVSGGGTFTTLTKAQTGTAAGVENLSNSEAYGSSYATFPNLGPNVGAVFNAKTTALFGSGALAATAGSASPLTYSSSIEWNVATSGLPPSGPTHPLDIGFVSGKQFGSTSFTNLTITVVEQGATVLNNNFTTAATATTYFTDDLVNLGAWTNDGSGALDVKVTFSETVAGTGNSYGVNFLLGVDPPAIGGIGKSAGVNPNAVPEPATVSVFGLGLLGLGWSKLRRRVRRAA
jgi:hypothetical protein